MPWDDDWMYPDSADLDDDGDVDFNERAEYDYMYDSIMGTNMSGFCPENDDDSGGYYDDEDDDEYEDENEDEEYSGRLDLEEITEADCDGYFTSDGTFNEWEIDDMFDSSDDDGFWDKCGNYHEYSDNYVPYTEGPIVYEETAAESVSEEYEEEPEYFDDEKIYGIIYDEFPKISDYYSKKQFVEDPSLLYKIYPHDRSFVIDCWDWVIRNYSEEFLNTPEADVSCGIFFELIPNVAYYEDVEILDGVFAKHLIRNSDLLEILFSKYRYESENYSLYEFLAWCVIMDDLDSFKKAYGIILGNKNYIGEPAEKAYIIEKIMFYLSEFTEELASVRFYEFFKAEIKSVSRKGRIPDLLKYLDKGIFGFQQFAKPSELISAKTTIAFSENFSFEEDEPSVDEVIFNDTPVGKILSKAYEEFPEMAEYVAPQALEENFYELLQVYSQNRPLAANFWAWIIENYEDELNDKYEYSIMQEDYFELIPKEMFIRDGEERNKFLQHYLAERPELMEILFAKPPYNLANNIFYQFLAWCIIRNDFTSFEKVYETILGSKSYVYQPVRKEHIIKNVLYWLKEFSRTSCGEKFYAFLKREIETLDDSYEKPELLSMLEEKPDGRELFAKPKNPGQYEKYFKAEYRIFENAVHASIPKKYFSKKAEKAVSSESRSDNSKTAESVGDASVLKELLERKRVLEAMLREVDGKIAEINALETSHKTNPEKENDEFFDNSGVAGMKYCDSEAIYDIRPNARLNLVREPENQYDKNAVAVYDQHGRKAGYLTKQTNIPIAHAMDEGINLYAKVVTLPLYEKYPNMKIEVWESK